MIFVAAGGRFASPTSAATVTAMVCETVAALGSRAVTVTVTGVWLAATAVRVSTPSSTATVTTPVSPEVAVWVSGSSFASVK